MIMKHISIVLLAGLAAVALPARKKRPLNRQHRNRRKWASGVILSALTAHCIFIR